MYEDAFVLATVFVVHSPLTIGHTVNGRTVEIPVIEIQCFFGDQSDLLILLLAGFFLPTGIGFALFA